MLKGRSKSFAPKSVPRGPSKQPPRRKPGDAPENPTRVSATPDRPSEPPAESPRPEKRKAQDDAVEPPAKRVPVAADKVIRPTPQASRTQLPSAPESTPAVTVEAAPVVEEIVNNNTPAPALSAISRSDSSSNSQVASTAEKATSAVPAREPTPVTNAEPESQLVEAEAVQARRNAESSASVQTPSSHTSSTIAGPATNRDDDEHAHPNNSRQPDATEDSILQSIEQSDSEAPSRNGRNQSRSPSPTPLTSFGPPGHRYPSPENLVRVGDSPAFGTPANMGPPGGHLGRAGDLAAVVGGELVQMATLNPDGTTGGIVEEPQSGTEKGKKKKKKVVRRKAAIEGDDDDLRATIDMGLRKARRQDRKTGMKIKKIGPKKPRKDREETPSDAEEEIIDPTVLTMSDLCKDLRIGKKFSKHTEIKARLENQKKHNQRERIREDGDRDTRTQLAEEDEAIAQALTRPTAAASGSTSNAGTEQASQIPAEPEASGNQIAFKMVDGNIVVDEESVQVDRRKQGEASRHQLEVVEENEFTKIVTSGTHLKREKNMGWDAISTDQFYKGLNQYGTDFNTIAALFPNRSRRQIKLKFNAEERKNPDKITRYLTQPKKAMDMEHFVEKSGKQLESIKDIEADIQREVDEKEAFYQATLAKRAQVSQAKSDAIQQGAGKKSKKDGNVENGILANVELGSDDEDTGPQRSAGESSKENAAPVTGKGRKKAPKKPRKNKHASNAGGDEVLVVDSIE